VVETNDAANAKTQSNKTVLTNQPTVQARKQGRRKDVCVYVRVGSQCSGNLGRGNDEGRAWERRGTSDTGRNNWMTMDRNN
jgi:hypothetical protein